MNILSVIIVTYNNEHELGDCLRSVIAQMHAGDEIIVVDNNSRDGTKKVLERFAAHISTILCRSNTGFAKGNNIGFRRAQGKYVLLLNPDAVLAKGAMGRMIDYLEHHPEVTVLAPLMCNLDGSPQQSVRRFPDYRILVYELLGLSRLFSRSPIFNRWRIPEFDYGKTQLVEQPMAASLMLRKSFFQHKLFDERFTMFFNDVDLCKRVLDSGGSIMFFPDARVLHARGASTAKVKERMFALHTRGFLQYFEKYSHSRIDGCMLCLSIPALVLNAMLRIFLNILGIK